MYALFSTILHEGLEHPRILIPQGVLELIPRRYQRTIIVWRESEFCYTWIFDYAAVGEGREGVGASNPLVVQGSAEFLFLESDNSFSLGVHLFLLQVDVTASSIPELERQIEKLSKVLCF